MKAEHILLKGTLTVAFKCLKHLLVVTLFLPYLSRYGPVCLSRFDMSPKMLVRQTPLKIFNVSQCYFEKMLIIVDLFLGPSRTHPCHFLPLHQPHNVFP